MLTAASLTHCGVPASVAKAHVGPASAAMREFGITSKAEARAFLAQCLHETLALRFMAEIWGPTPAQRTYVGRMGNRSLAEAFRYRGRGVIMLTGRDNYRTYGGKLHVDLLGHPELASKPATGWRIAALYWRTRVRPAGTPLPDFRTITIRINGGLNGYADRVRYWTLLGGVGVVPGLDPAVAKRRRWYESSIRRWKHSHAEAVKCEQAARKAGDKGRERACHDRRRKATRVIAKRRKQLRGLPA